MAKQMTIDDDQKSYGRTSLTMTRSMSEDIGLKVKKTLEDIDNNTINYSHTQWQEFVTYCWSDEIWTMAMNEAIRQAKIEDIDLNINKEFLYIISKMSLSELKEEFRKTHPIARLALMDLIGKKPKKEEEHRKYEDLWLTPKELREKYKGD